jgi:predicted transcriptional regulator
VALSFASGIRSNSSTAAKAAEAMSLDAAQKAALRAGENSSVSNSMRSMASQLLDEKNRRAQNPWESVPESLNAVIVIDDNGLSQYVIGTAVTPLLQAGERVLAGRRW